MPGVQGPPDSELPLLLSQRYLHSDVAGERCGRDWREQGWRGEGE